MATERFIHIVAVTAIASAMVTAAPHARAEGGGDDRALMHWNGRIPAQNQSQAVVSQPERVSPAVPLPPRRPKVLEAAEPATPPAIQAEAFRQPDLSEPSSPPVLALQQPFNGAMLTLPPQSAAPPKPLVYQPLLRADRFQGASAMPRAEQRKPADPVAVDPQSGAGPEFGETVTAPLPPQRPAGLEESGAKVELASLQPPPVQQPSEPPAGVVSDNASAGNAPGFFERLFTAPPGRVSESVQNQPAQPRAMSRLNHIIGDDPARANQLRALISKHAAANGLPFKFADAVVRVESRYNPRARNGPYIGLMQIHPRTAQSLGYNGDTAGLFDPDTNLQYGIKYLAMAYRLAGGDTCGTVMRYQGGHRAVSMTSANRVYCNKVKMIFSENR